MRHSQPAQGFTLVEVAIVIVIIGLLIGGILKGMEMVRTAKVTATVSAVKAYMTATRTFEDKYGQLPGDIFDATNKIPGCVAGTCFNGDGNSVIGVRMTDATYQTVQSGATGLPAVETSMYWKHLVLSGMITGINGAANISSPAAGSTHPASPIGGIFDIATIFGNPLGNDIGNGLHLRLQRTFGPVGNGGFIPPGIAEQIDIKMDDGLPDQGSVNADSVASGCDIGGVYQSAGNGVCFMFFNF